MNELHGTTYVVEVHVKIDALTGAEALDKAIEQMPEAESYKLLSRANYYIEYRSGNCSIVAADDAAAARDMAGRDHAGSPITVLRLATMDDMMEFEALGGMVRS